jgi:GT2 family glycosyltransferase
VPDLSFPALDGFRLVSCEIPRGAEGTPVRFVHPDPGLRTTFAPQSAIPGGWYQLELKFAPEGLVDVVVQFSFADDVLWLRMPAIARNHLVAQFRLEKALQEVTLIVTGSGRLGEPTICRFEHIGRFEQLAVAARRGAEIFRRDGFRVMWSGLNYVWRLTRPGPIAISHGSAAAPGETPYEAWVRVFDEAPQRDRTRHEERLAALKTRPLISILATDAPAVTGLDAQIYPAWELVTRDRLNAALADAKGEFILPLASMHLRPHSLLDLALTIERVPDAKLIYTDEDTIEAGKRGNWRFKPAWSPNLLKASNYLGQLTLLHTESVRAAGGWRSEAADERHDLLLRLTRQAHPRAIVHLARVLAHATKEPQAADIQVVTRKDPDPPVRVSLIIPTRDGADLLATCVRSIRSLTRYPNYEIIIVDNGSVQDATRRLLAELASDGAIRILPRAEAFNFSRLNNAAARVATGTILGLINNDVEITHPDWLDEMVALAIRPEIGCVGAKLLYPDGRLQHAGVVIGLGGVAGHAHRFARADDPGYLGCLRSVHEVSAVTAACLLIRREVFEGVGGLDEELTVAFNDVDFCLKVRAAGYLNLWTPFAELTHHESVSRGRDLTPAKAKRFAAEYAGMQRRWGAQLLSDPYYSPHLTYDREDYSLRLR